jgi:uncharacterized NAD(P)/FAD-binding protein YdhS
VQAGTSKARGIRSQISVHLADGETLTGDVVINATGPATRLTATASLLLQNLLHRGLLVPDTTDMGISVDRDQRC